MADPGREDEFAEAPLPLDGGFRVHPTPEILPSIHEDHAGPNRYDDPDGLYRVRYTAERLTGALIETMARFRPHPAAEQLLADIENVDDDDRGADEAAEADPADSLTAWLETQRVGRLKVTTATRLLNVHDPSLLTQLDKHPRVRMALEASGLGTPKNPARLDEGIIRIGGPIGRPITQAVSRAVYEIFADVGGLAYFSRLDDRERCWALWDRTPLTISSTPLSQFDPAHRTAVRTAAAVLEIDIPPPWS